MAKVGGTGGSSSPQHVDDGAVCGGMSPEELKKLSPAELKAMGIDVEPTPGSGAPNAKTTARPKSMDAHGLDLRSQLEEKLKKAGKTEAPKTGTTGKTGGAKWPLDTAGIGAAIKKAFEDMPGSTAKPTGKTGEWAVSDKNGPFMWVEVKNGKMTVTGEENFSASSPLKAGDDFVAKLKELRGGGVTNAEEGELAQLEKTNAAIMDQIQSSFPNFKITQKEADFTYREYTLEPRPGKAELPVKITIDEAKLSMTTYDFKTKKDATKSMMLDGDLSKQKGLDEFAAKLDQLGAKFS